MSEKRTLIVNTLSNGVAQFVTMLASLVFMPLLIDGFGLETYGLFMLASSVSAYTVLLDFGIGSALTKFVAEHHASGDRTALTGSIASALLLYTGAGVIGAAAMILVGQFAGSVFHVGPEQARLLRTMLWIGAALQLWYWPASVARQILAGMQRFRVLAATAVLSAVLSIGVTLLVVIAGYGPVVLVTLNGFVMIVASLFNILAAKRISGIPRLGYAGATRRYALAILSFSWAVFVVQLSDVLFYQQTDRVLLGVLAGAAAVGLYEAAAKFSVLLTYVSGLTVSAVLPLASKMYSQGRQASVHALFIRGTKYAAALVAPVAVVMMVLAKPLILAWLGPRFAGQVIVAQVLVLPHLVVCLGLMGDAVITSKGRLHRRVPYILAQALLNVALSVALIPSLGTLGVAVGTAVAHLIDFPFHMYLLFKEIEVSPADFLRAVVLPVYAPLVAAAPIAYVLSETALGSSLAGIAVAAAIALMAYWAILVLAGLSEQERMEARRVLAAMQSRLRSNHATG